jgi:hypothetical protein
MAEFLLEMRRMKLNGFALMVVVVGLCVWAHSLVADEIPFGISLQHTVNMRNGSIGVIVSLTPLGPTGGRVEAGRVTVSRACDDMGGSLTLSSKGKFYSVSVGRVDASKDLTSREPLTFSLWGLAKNAKALKTVDGEIELVVPDLDSHSVVVVDLIASKFGSPIDSSDLAEARGALLVYDKKSADGMAQVKSADGPQNYDSGPLFGPPPPGLPSWAATGARPTAMDANDLAVAISDPESRLLSVEFQTKDGRPIRYDHRGRYHSSEPSGHREVRFDVYHLDSSIPPDARLVCHLITDKSLVSIPIHMENVLLPEGSQQQRDGGTLVVALGETTRKNIQLREAVSVHH